MVSGAILFTAGVYDNMTRKPEIQSLPGTDIVLHLTWNNETIQVESRKSCEVRYVSTVLTWYSVHCCRPVIWANGAIVLQRVDLHIIYFATPNMKNEVLLLETGNAE